jgi:hypothetical protein
MRRLYWLLIVLSILLISHPAVTQLESLLDTLPDCDFSTQIDRDDLNLGAVIVNFDNGLGCIENIDQTFNTASVPKIFVAGAYYDLLMNGLLQPAEYEFTRAYWMGGRSDCLGEDQIGDIYSGEALIDLMINCSDNAATWMLMDAIGWNTVNGYIDQLGIAGIGQVIPYAEVDRRKLEFLDPRWGDVPRGMASRYYRGRMTDGLSAYFDTIPPRPDRETFARINQQYFETYTTNTLTPRALARYIIQLRADFQSSSFDSLIAGGVIDTMLFTQRQFSTQALPGTVYVGSKNGFDRGLLAEANVLFSSLDERVPSGMVLMFAQYDTLTTSNANLAGPFGGELNALFRTLSPQISERLYPNYRLPPAQGDLTLSTVIFNTTDQIQRCWRDYFRSGFAQSSVPALETCFRSIGSRLSFGNDQNLGMGLTLRGLGNRDTRFVFVFTAPDGRIFSYQTDRRSVNDSAIYWFHPIDMVGSWQVNIFMNLRRVHTETIVVQR